MQAPESQPEQEPDVPLEDAASDVSSLQYPSDPAPRPPSPPTVYLPSLSSVDAQARQKRRDAWMTQPNYGGWGDAKARFLWRHIGRSIWFYVREDWIELPLSWDGVDERDTSKDGLDVIRWAEFQLHRCSPHAADHNLGPPTFTGPQVLQRSQDVQTQLQQLRAREDELSTQMAEVQAEIQQYQAAQDNIKDLDTLAHGLSRA
ncbi:hypothetical protein V5O48_014877 [Marasmius crinis-equi]|uniref:Uncharacterized protein n=1 Tax=Marasmius crinis-equi TaxID=585013 RepID=A0ABR3EW41_9AGAR